MSSDEKPLPYNARLGVILFAVYSAFYFAYVFVSAFAPQWSEWTPGGGINLAVLWGFALIAVALVMAVVYGMACRPEPSADRGSEAGATEQRESTS